MSWWDKLMGRGRRGHFLKLPPKQEKFLQDDTWFCGYCHGPALFAANADRPALAVRFIGYEHKLDCPTLREHEQP